MTEISPVPPALQAAWGMREKPTKGPKPTLSVDRIVAAAIAVARAEGYPAVSMNRVAGELKTSAMSLYRYVASKDELAVLMMEAAAGEPPAPRTAGETWRAAVERWAHAMFTMFGDEPWFLQVPIAAPPATPRQLAWMETGLAALDGLPLPESEKLSLLLLVNGYIRYEALLRGQMTEAARAHGRTVDAVIAEFGGLMRHLVQADRFPLLRRAIDAGAMDTPGDPAGGFTFGLSRILDGIEAFVRSHPAP
ncbi:TetR/AcrR family transcriptional regulator C-terminal domain-containing protein [Actinoplanes palleronii]|uniref:TetR family transcriptional regulator n=1 Tax=Actinoplanes palleronii TaxID=113570 RepID=A0ABQ4B8Q5_9ACTN|nr:TetR/AcrR family transcriptional regulator C-terminal domain-containing protein [Actinoplanes palleronii]GIE67023.1 TetR family transcriptional regulator [Actinoplanes palleronii]